MLCVGFQAVNRFADMGLCFLCVWLLCLVEVSGHVIPKNYIVKVTPTCGPTDSSDAYITLTTDLHARATAVCRDNRNSFTDVDGVNFHLDVSYPPSTKFPCVFQNKVNTSIYTLLIKVAWGDSDGMVLVHEEEFQVTCTFEDKKTQQSLPKAIMEGLIAPVEIQSHMGSDSVSSVKLKLCDVLGNSFIDYRLAIGRKVQLVAETNGAGGEKGIRPVHCDAVGVPNGKRYAILRAGCGDGLVFNKTEGFQTRDMFSYSPYFDVFNIPEENHVKFECNFTMCNIECNGSSCTNEKPELFNP